MPVAENDRVAPKSALRHRPIISEYEELSIPAWTTPTPRASRKIQTKRETPVASNSKSPAKKKQLPSVKRHQTLHWGVPVVLTIMSMLLLTMGLQLAWNWGTSTYFSRVGFFRQVLRPLYAWVN